MLPNRARHDTNETTAMAPATVGNPAANHELREHIIDGMRAKDCVENAGACILYQLFERMGSISRSDHCYASPTPARFDTVPLMKIDAVKASGVAG